jgi:hypothetical protein
MQNFYDDSTYQCELTNEEKSVILERMDQEFGVKFDYEQNELYFVLNNEIRRFFPMKGFWNGSPIFSNIKFVCIASGCTEEKFYESSLHKFCKNCYYYNTDNRPIKLAIDTVKLALQTLAKLNRAHNSEGLYNCMRIDVDNKCHLQIWLSSALKNQYIMKKFGLGEKDMVSVVPSNQCIKYINRLRNITFISIDEGLNSNTTTVYRIENY